MVKIIIEYINEKNNIKYNTIEETTINNDINNYIKYNIIFGFIEDFENRYKINVYKCTRMIMECLYISDDKNNSMDLYFVDKIKLEQYKILLNEYEKINIKLNSGFVKYKVSIIE